MTLSTKTTIKTYFQTGDFPSQGNFSDFIDSCVFQKVSAQATAQAIGGSITIAGSCAVSGDFSVGGNSNFGGTATFNNIVVSGSLLPQLPANTALVNATAVSALPTSLALTASTVVGRASSGNIVAVPFSTITAGTVAATPITNSLSGNVALNNTGTYFDGPSVAQGSVGTWFVSGTVTVIDTAGIAGFKAKLWDGTTIIASTNNSSITAGAALALSLSGFITSPVGNLRISVNDQTSTSGIIENNASGNGKDSTITAFRIA